METIKSPSLDGLSLYGGTITSNNLTIIKRIIGRFSEKVVFKCNGALVTPDIEKIKFIVNNIINRHNFLAGCSDVNLIEEKGYQVDFKPGSALYKINALVASSKEEDINKIVDLYVNEANIFISELRETVKPVISDVINSFNNDKDAKLKNSGSNFRLKQVTNIELFDFLESNGKLKMVSDGLIPATLSLGFPLDSDIKSNEALVRELFITGNTEIDSIAKPFLEDMTVNDLLTFWQKYMLNIGYENSNLQALYTLHYRKTDDLILLYLALSRILSGKVHFTTSSEVLEKYKISINDILKNIITKYNNYVKMISENILISDYYKEDDNITTIYVNPSKYQEYLENGGSVDNIVGYTIKSSEENLPKVLRLDTMLTLENLGEYHKKLINIEKMADHTYNLNMLASLWKSYTSKIIGDLCNINGRVICFNKDKTEDVLKYVNNLSNNDVLDTSKVVINIVTILNKDVGDFISDMNNMLSTIDKNPEDVAKEASTYAIVQRLANKLLSDTTTCKVS